jgi:predicted flavoprotein YhiN
MMITQDGVEGGVVYALSSVLQDKIAQDGCAELVIDLRPDQTTAGVAKALSTPRGGRSLSAHLTRRLRLSPVARAVLFEAFGYKTLESLPAQDLAVRIKAVTLRTYRDSGLVRAISTAGGVTRDAVSESLMLKALPGVFIAGEMLDWDAPTGGYLLQGCFATGLRAGKGVCAWLEQGAGEGYTQATP